MGRLTKAVMTENQYQKELESWNPSGFVAFFAYLPPLLVTIWWESNGGSPSADCHKVTRAQLSGKEAWILRIAKQLVVACTNLEVQNYVG
jgi:hypothetical protein